MLKNRKRWPIRIRRPQSVKCRRRRSLATAIQSLEDRRLLAFSADAFADINLFGVSSNVESIVEFDGRAFFSADDGQNGTELWSSDGTAGGTTLFADLLPGNEGSQPSDLTVVGSELFFTARDESGEFDLWKSDGTVSGTEIVFDANAAGVYGLERLTESGGKLFFTAYQIDTDPGPGDNATGQELWVSNGTSAGTMLLLDINPDQTSYGGEGPQELTDHNGTLFFTSYDASFNRDLWQSNGTTATTIKVADLDDLTTSELSSIGTDLFFAAETTTDGLELYVYDGSTTSLIDVNPGIGSSSPTEITEFGGLAYFSANDGSGTRNLFSSNGTTFSAVGTGISSPAELTVVGSSLFFAADGASGRELYRTDGTTNTLVEDIVAGGSSNPSKLTESGGRLYFSADEPTSTGRELWTTVELGTPATTEMLVDSRTGVDLGGSPLDGNPEDLFEIGGTLYFTTLDGAADRELWTSNGTPVTTNELKDINPTTKDADVEQLVVSGSEIYFVASDGINGDAVWVADTNTPGSVTMIDVTPGTAAESIRGLSLQDGSIWFYNNLGGDGSNGGTYRINTTSKVATEVKRMSVDPADNMQTVEVSVIPTPLSVDGNDFFETLAGRVYFASETTQLTLNPMTSTYSETDVGVELMATDVSGGNIASLVSDIYPLNNNNGRPNSSDPQELTSFNGKLYFSAFTDTNGRELWETDGTTTTLSHDINTNDSGADGSSPLELTVSGDYLFFSASDGTDSLSGNIGRELWSLSLANLLTGFDIDTTVNTDVSDGSFPINLTDVNGTLYFAADLDNGDIDKEPYSADGVNAPIPVRRNSVSNQIGDGSGSNPSGFVQLGSSVYFAASGTASGPELWRTTAAPSGTFTPSEEVSDITGSSGANPTEIASIGSRIFFAGNDENAADRELWVAGGSLGSGTAQALDMLPGVFQGGQPSEFVDVGGTVYFAGTDDEVGRELFELEEFTPQVESVVINDGSAQRSQITSVTVTFDAIVDIDLADFVLTNIDTATTVTNVMDDTSVEDFKTVAVLTFGLGASVVGRAGTGVLGNSLDDGNYRLDVLAAGISDPTGGPGLAADFFFGGHTAADVPNDDFFRRFGDIDGGGVTNFGDFAGPGGFLGAFGASEGDPHYSAALDADGNGTVNFPDFALPGGFLSNFGKSRL